MKENQFLEVMRKHSDDELLEILNIKRTEYVADAIAAVEEVLQERGVSYEKKSDEIVVAGNKILTVENLREKTVGSYHRYGFHHIYYYYDFEICHNSRKCNYKQS